MMMTNMEDSNDGVSQWGDNKVLDLVSTLVRSKLKRYSRNPPFSQHTLTNLPAVNRHLLNLDKLTSFRGCFPNQRSVCDIINVQLSVRLISGLWAVHIAVCRRETFTHVTWTAKQEKWQYEWSVKACSVNATSDSVPFYLHIGPVRHPSRQLLSCKTSDLQFIGISLTRFSFGREMEEGRSRVHVELQTKQHKYDYLFIINMRREV